MKIVIHSANPLQALAMEPSISCLMAFRLKLETVLFTLHERTGLLWTFWSQQNNILNVHEGAIALLHLPVAASDDLAATSMKKVQK